MFLAQETVSNPQTWANIADRLGIPFAILLMIFFGGAVAAMWLARNVIKPVTSAHLSFVESIKGSQTQITEQSKLAVGQNFALIESARLHQEAIIKHDKETAARDEVTMQRLEKIASLLEKECPLLKEQKK